jgi:sortase (surface protein transpeptidase)
MESAIHKNQATSGEVQKFGEEVQQHDTAEKTQRFKEAVDGKEKMDEVVIGEEWVKSVERHGKPKIPEQAPTGYHLNISLEKND